MNRITALAGALLCLMLTCGIADARPRSIGLHHDCNVTMPCAVPSDARVKPGRHARAGRYRNVEFGGPLAPGETQRSFLKSPDFDFAASVGLSAPRVLRLRCGGGSLWPSDPVALAGG